MIPPQKAGKIAALAGVADHTGWCPVDPVTFELLQQKNIHVIGDAALAGAMPKSAFSGSIEGKLCATAVATLLRGETPAAAKLTSNCYSMVAPNYAISISGLFEPVNGEYAEVEGSARESIKCQLRLTRNRRLFAPTNRQKTPMRGSTTLPQTIFG